MRKLIFFLILVMSFHTSMGQLVEEVSYKPRGARNEVKIARHVPDSKIDEVILAFHDADDPAWSPITWCQELSWLASERNAGVLVPATGIEEVDSSKVSSMLKLISDSISMEQCRILVLGGGVKNARPFISLGLDGLIIAPSDTLSSEKNVDGSVYGIIDARPTDSAASIEADLIAQGAWTFRKLVIADHPYYFDHHKEVIREMFHRMDSTRTSLEDTLMPVSQTKVVKIGPEILKQGKVFETKLFVARHGQFKAQVLNLSAEPVAEYERFLGKGNQTISIPTKDLEWGVYKIEIDGPGVKVRHKLMIRG